MDTPTPVTKSVRKSGASIKMIIDEFVKAIDTEKEHTLDEMKKVLTETYKTLRKKKVKNPLEKKEPSEYNIFIKEEMKKIRLEEPSVDNKVLMSKAASRWKLHKEEKASK